MYVLPERHNILRMYVCIVAQCQVYNLKFVVGKKGPRTLKQLGEISVTVYSDPYRQQVVVDMCVRTYVFM